MSDTLIKVENVSKKFCRSLKKSLWYGIKDLGGELIGRSHSDHDGLRPDEFWAVDDVSFELKRGECLGLIGRNGAGKTTLLRMLNGLIKPDKGKIEMRGRVGALIALGAGFNPILTGRENIYVNASVLGLKKNEIEAKFDDIVEFSELEEFIDTPVQSYSSGMQVRLGFSIATALDPDILLLDEILAVGDIGFKHKSHNRIIGLTERCAVIVVSHSMPNLTRLSTDIFLLNKGKKIYHGKNVEEGIDNYYKQFPDEQSRIIGNQDVIINNFNIHGKSTNDITINYLDDLSIDLDFMYLKEKCADVLSIEIFDSNLIFVAECFIDLPLDKIKADRRNKMTIILPKLQLSSGKYNITILFCKKLNGTPNAQFITQYRSIGHFVVMNSITTTHAPFLLQCKIDPF
jgi:lipopolysaccharide transport system ATP-binding protein